MTEDIDALEPGETTNAKVSDALYPEMRGRPGIPIQYSTDWTVAMEAAEEVGLLDRWRLEYHQGVWLLEDKIPWEDMWGFRVEARTGPMAVCKAILRDVQIRDGKQPSEKLSTSGPHLFDVLALARQLADMVKSSSVRFDWRGLECAIKAGEDPESAAWDHIGKLVRRDGQIGKVKESEGMTVLEIVKFMMDGNARDSVHDLVAQYLEGWEFDGLYSDNCCCLASELAPCGEMKPDCRAGVKVPCDGKGEFCEEGCEWHIVPKQA